MMKLWHCETDREHVVRDAGWLWCFWQKSKPYRISDSPALPVCFSDDCYCEVYTLGGEVRLYSGPLADVPFSLRSYLHEVRVRL